MHFVYQTAYTDALTSSAEKVDYFPGLTIISFLDAGKLPYMAMLRNLRNLALVDLDDDHMNKVVRKLTAIVRRFKLSIIYLLSLNVNLTFHFPSG